MSNNTDWSLLPLAHGRCDGPLVISACTIKIQAIDGDWRHLQLRTPRPRVSTLAFTNQAWGVVRNA